jgi:hypothetical protein
LKIAKALRRHGCRAGVVSAAVMALAGAGQTLPAGADLFVCTPDVNRVSAPVCTPNLDPEATWHDGIDAATTVIGRITPGVTIPVGVH